MSRFQALTNPVVDAELEIVRKRLGLEPRQKADLLREIAAIAGWVLRQAELGRAIESRAGTDVEELAHPAVERVRASRAKGLAARLVLSEPETARLAALLDRGFDPPAPLRRALANLASPKRRPPKLRWKKSAA